MNIEDIDKQINKKKKEYDKQYKKLHFIEVSLRCLEEQKKKLIVDEKKYHTLDELKKYKGKTFNHITVIVQQNNGTYEYDEYVDCVEITDFGKLKCCNFSDNYFHFGYTWDSIWKCYCIDSCNNQNGHKVNIIGFYDLY